MLIGKIWRGFERKLLKKEILRELQEEHERRGLTASQDIIRHRNITLKRLQTCILFKEYGEDPYPHNNGVNNMDKKQHVSIFVTFFVIFLTTTLLAISALRDLGFI